MCSKKLKNGAQYIVTLCVRYEGGLFNETEQELLYECVGSVERPLANLPFEVVPVSIELFTETPGMGCAKSPGHGK